MYKLRSIQGSLFKQRLIIKGFKTPEAMHKFLNSQYNNDWKEDKTDPRSRDNLAPGTYAMLGGKWTNVKNIDPSTLCHI